MTLSELQRLRFAGEALCKAFLWSELRDDLPRSAYGDEIRAALFAWEQGEADALPVLHATIISRRSFLIASDGGGEAFAAAVAHSMLKRTGL